MILTELPKAVVPAHIREAVADLPVPRAPGVGEPYSDDIPENAPEPQDRGRRVTPDRSTEPIPDAPASKEDRPYAHLINEALRDAIRKAVPATRATRAAAEKAEAMAHRAEQQAAAGTGPNVLALGRQRQDLTAPAEAAQDVHALMDAAAQYAHAQRDRNGRLHQLEQQLNATGRFGRPALRGDDRTHAEAERETLHQHRAENVRELEGLHERLREQAAGAGPVEEHDAVLTEAEKLKRDEAALLRRAQAKDNQVAKPLRAEAAKSRSTARGAEY